jgi:amino acid transporter
LRSVGLPFVVKDVFGSTAGTVFLVDVTIAVLVCALVVQTGAVRMIYAMARDDRIPISKTMAKVSSRTQLPPWPAVVVGALALGVMLLNIDQTQIITDLISIALVISALAYLGVIGPLLMRRIKGWPGPDMVEGQKAFSLGRFGIMCNTLAMGFLMAVGIDLGWPRRAIYNPAPPFHWYLQWAPELYVAVIAGVGGLYYALVQRGRPQSPGESEPPVSIVVVPEGASPGSDDGRAKPGSTA